ncbi:hypothetical protein [Pseudarthrobacter cellobiosi]|uniref:hypothetical protein n=1 Tax=Pseudarthrobacter cellobiosi TaxID=2953654 RepID=UPI00208FDCE0|nr:hypothetical protein [Pseudarthrobacter sp. HLT1-5]MCO4257382.1 hypothetical protein [Pseudarthrobacter sp. HLT1-5]
MTRTEYAAQLPNRVIYMHDFLASKVRDFMTEYGTAAPLQLVTRQWVGDTHGKWEAAA